MLRTVPGQNLTVAAYERLRADVLACRLRPGQRLKVNELCASFSVSLGAIREALSRLTAEGLIVATPQRGFSVAPISSEDLRDLTSVRVEIEQSCLRRAIAAGDITWESKIVAALHRLSRTPERVSGDEARLNEAWVEAHAAFHEALVAACDSPWSLRLRAQLYAQAERYRRLSVPLARIARDLKTEHRALADAVLARDTSRSTALIAEHLSLTMHIIINGADLPDSSVSGWAASNPGRPIAYDTAG